MQMHKSEWATCVQDLRSCQVSEDAKHLDREQLLLELHKLCIL